MHTHPYSNTLVRGLGGQLSPAVSFVGYGFKSCPDEKKKQTFRGLEKTLVSFRHVFLSEQLAGLLSPFFFTPRVNNTNRAMTFFRPEKRTEKTRVSRQNVFKNGPF